MLRARSAQIWTGGVEAMRGLLRDEIRSILTRPAEVVPFATRPWVVFVVGVNGVGKTTTIGKLAAPGRPRARSVARLRRRHLPRRRRRAARRSGRERTGVALSSQGPGRGPERGALSTRSHARARRARRDVLVDTAGRLHTKGNLMAELDKMTRVAGREVAGRAARDAARARRHERARTRSTRRASSPRPRGVTGLVLTKLDGTAKGGVAVAVVRELGVPIRYVGVGEAVEDLLPSTPPRSPKPSSATERNARG